MPKVNPEILRWARDTAGLTLEEASRKLKIAPSKDLTAVDRLAALESGKVEPSRPMLVKMAKQYHRPLITFYLSKPPKRGNRGKDFRTLPLDRPAVEDALLDALVRDIQARQSMVRSALEDEEEAIPIPFVGSMNRNDGVQSVLSSIRETLNVSLEDFRAQPSPSDAFRLLRAGAERAGVFVLLKGDLGSHHTAIDLQTFRGFALADSVAPFVVINDQDSKAAWSFTLLHELAHIWLGQTGVSGLWADKWIERFCNDVASEYLLPPDEARRFRPIHDKDIERLQNEIGDFARKRNLSASMVAYNLMRIGSIDRETWELLRTAFRKRWEEERSRRRKKAREQEGGPSFYTVRAHRIGKALLDLVGRMLAAGTLTTSKASKVLGVKAKQVQELLSLRSQADLNPSG